MSPQTERYEGHFSAPRQKKLRRMGGGLLALLALLLSLSRLGSEAFKLLAYADVFIGGGRMLANADVQQVDVGEAVNGVPVFNEAPSVEPTQEYILRLDDGTTIVYQGHTYQLNRDLSTILCLGVDKTLESTEIIGTAGQSDVILLVGMDTKTGKTTVLIIPRDCYAQVDTYSINNHYTGIESMQITAAFGYGDGQAASCENARQAVSRLLYGLPISSYLALDMNAIQAANEAVGHVTVKSLIDVDMGKGVVFHEGDSIELQGRWLDRYIRTRGHDLEANAKRNLRQMQYVTEFSKLVVAKSKGDLSFPVELFSTLAPYMVTSLEIPDVTFLSSVFLSHGADFQFRTISGTFGKLDGSTVLYPDETDLFEAVLELFYKRVD